MTVLVKGIPRRRRARKTKESYWQKRSSTLRFLFFLLAGVLLGSIYSTAAGKDSLICAILVRQLAIIPESTLWGLLRERLLFAGILVFFLFIAGGSYWGKYMIPAAPLFFGMSQGISVTYLFILLGWNAWKYLAVCVLFPKGILTVILLILCNISNQRYAALASTGERQRTTAENFLWWAAVAALLLECLLEQYLRMKLCGWILS